MADKKKVNNSYMRDGIEWPAVSISFPVSGYANYRLTMLRLNSGNSERKADIAARLLEEILKDESVAV